MPVRLDSARDTIPGHILLELDPCAESRQRLLLPLRLDGPPCLSVLTLHSPMLPSNAGRRQGKAGILCLTMLVHVRPSAWPNASQGSFHQPQSDSITAFPARPRTVSEAAASPSTSAGRSKGPRRQDPRRGPHSPLELSFCCRTSSARRQTWEILLHHVPRRIFLPRVCPSLGARLTPLPFIASPFTLLSVTPTGTRPV